MPVEVLTSQLEPIVPPTSGAAGDDIIARRKAIHERAERAEREEHHRISLSDPEPTRPMEMLDTVEIQTPAGLVVFGPPRGVSVTMRIATMFGEMNPNRLVLVMLRTLMCVQSIDGKAVPPITNMVEAQNLANMLTDPVVDFLAGALQEYWPPPSAGDLQIVAKNKQR